MAIAFTSCLSPSLESVVSKIQNELPKEMGDGTKMTECEIRNGYFECVLSYNEEQISFDDAFVELAFEAMREEYKNTVMEDDTFREILSLCKSEGKGFRFLFKGEKTGKTVPLFEITHEELLKDDSL